LRRGDPLYDLVLPLDWNWPEAVPGQGSAIFIHQWRRPGFPTAGCLAFSRKDLFFIARNAAPGTRVVVPAR
jgi:L,D-peptidoglycan transpeptidase YkuD (ErfK/YbiS/YcfS/YnhG family)